MGSDVPVFGSTRWLWTENAQYLRGRSYGYRRNNQKFRDLTLLMLLAYPLFPGGDVAYTGAYPVFSGFGHGYYPHLVIPLSTVHTECWENNSISLMLDTWNILENSRAVSTRPRHHSVAAKGRNMVHKITDIYSGRMLSVQFRTRLCFLECREH